MARDTDECRCVVLGRSKPTQPYNVDSIIVITERKSVAWRSAHGIQKQEREILGNLKFEAKVITLDDYDHGKFKVNLKPPAGFDLEYPGGAGEESKKQ